MKTTEVWMPTHAPGYEVSNLGRVRSLARTVSCGGERTRPVAERVIKQRIAESGFAVVNIRTQVIAVHRLVAVAFLGDHPGWIVTHRSENRLDNSVANVVWHDPDTWTPAQRRAHRCSLSRV